MDDKYTQHVKFVTIFESCLANVQAQLYAPLSDCETLHAANNDLIKHGKASREVLSTLRARVLKLETRLEAPCAPSSHLAKAMRDRDCFKALLYSLVAQAQSSKLIDSTSWAVLKAIKLLFATTLVLCWKRSNLLRLTKNLCLTDTRDHARFC